MMMMMMMHHFDIWQKKSSRSIADLNFGHGLWPGVVPFVRRVHTNVCSLARGWGWGWGWKAGRGEGEGLLLVSEQSSGILNGGTEKRDADESPGLGGGCWIKPGLAETENTHSNLHHLLCDSLEIPPTPPTTTTTILSPHTHPHISQLYPL